MPRRGLRARFGNAPAVPFVALLLVFACRGAASHSAASPGEPLVPRFHDEGASATTQAAPFATPARARQASSLRTLEVPGFQNALLFVPAGDASRPLLVAAHGAGGSPEWECEYWRRLTREHAFLLCLRGTPLGTYDAYYYKDHLSLEREFVAAERAAREREPRIALGSGVYAGFSQGATMGSAMIANHAASFPFLVLIEGFDLWNVQRSKRFASTGGKRVLIACGSKECAKVGRNSAHWLEVGGVGARFEFVPRAGHTPTGEVMERVNDSLEWLLADEPLWR